MQANLFDRDEVGAAALIPQAPALEPHAEWPFPGLSPQDSARSALANSEAYADMLAAVVKSQGGGELTDGQVRALIPEDWKALLGRWVHASLCPRRAAQRGIEAKYMAHDNGTGGFTFAYRLAAQA